MKGAAGYEIQWCLKKNFKKGVKAKVLSGAGKTKFKMTKLKKGKKYFVRVRAFSTAADGSKLYSGWTVVKKKTRKK